MSEVEPNVDQLLERTLDRSRSLRVRRRMITAGSATGVLVAVLALMVVVGIGSRRGGTPGHADVHVGSSTCSTAASNHHACVDVPPVAASPETVVRTFLHALDRQDSALAKQLCEPGFRVEAESAMDSWFTNVRSITKVTVLGTSTEYDPSRRPLPQGYREVITVSTSFVLQQREARSMNDGDTAENFTLVRRGPGSRWLIEEIGMG